MIALPTMKPAAFIAASLAEISAMPDEVKRVFGFAIRLAQRGEKHPDAKPLKGFGGAGVLEVVEDYDGNTYRAIYTVKFAGMARTEAPAIVRRDPAFQAIRQATPDRETTCQMRPISSRSKKTRSSRTA